MAATKSDEAPPVEDELTDAQIIARRTVDIDEDKAKGNEHVKVFVLSPIPKPDKDFDHEPNKAATIQYLLSQGMRPTGDVRLVSVEAHNGSDVAWDLTYAVKVVPAERANYPDPGGNAISNNRDATK